MHNFPDLRLITKVSRLYYEERLTQTEIAGRVGISQVAVSRLLKRAEEYGIVRTTVISPPGAFAELEGLLEEKFGLSKVIIAEASRDSEEAVLNAIGSAAAQFLETVFSVVRKAAQLAFEFKLGRVQRLERAHRSTAGRPEHPPPRAEQEESIHNNSIQDRLRNPCRSSSRFPHGRLTPASRDSLRVRS